MTDKEKKTADEIADKDLDDVTGGLIMSGSTFRTASTLVNTTQDANTVDGSFSADALDAGQTPPISFSIDLDKTTR